MTIYVSNMGCHFTSAGLYQLFAQIGNVASAHVVTDKETGKSLRYGFVDMPDEKSGNEAIDRLNGKLIEGWMMSVHISKPENAESARVSVRRVQAMSLQAGRPA